jgi:hypothetical protein
MPGRFLLAFGVIGLVASPVQAQYLKTAASKNGMFKDCADCPQLIVVPGEASRWARRKMSRSVSRNMKTG